MEEDNVYYLNKLLERWRYIIIAIVAIAMVSMIIYLIYNMNYIRVNPVEYCKSFGFFRMELPYQP